MDIGRRYRQVLNVIYMDNFEISIERHILHALRESTRVNPTKYL